VHYNGKESNILCTWKESIIYSKKETEKEIMATLDQALNFKIFDIPAWINQQLGLGKPTIQQRIVGVSGISSFGVTSGAIVGTGLVAGGYYGLTILSNWIKSGFNQITAPIKETQASINKITSLPSDATKKIQDAIADIQIPQFNIPSISSGSLGIRLPQYQQNLPADVSGFVSQLKIPTDEQTKTDITNYLPFALLGLGVAIIAFNR
jgi:hypothetical protein